MSTTSTLYHRQKSTPAITLNEYGFEIPQPQPLIIEQPEPETSLYVEEDWNAKLRRTSSVGKRFNLEDLNTLRKNTNPKYCKCCNSLKCPWLSPDSTCGFLCQKENILITLTILGVFSGVILGVTLNIARGKWSEAERLYVRFIGDLFLSCLKCLILPLIVSSLVSVIGCLDLSLSRRIGIRAIVYYLLTTVIAVIIGIALVYFIEPGKKGTVFPTSFTSKVQQKAKKNDSEVTDPAEALDTFFDLVRNMFPPNLVQATFKTYRTKRIRKKINETDVELKGQFEDGTNIIGIVIYTVLLGAVISKLGYRGYPLLDFATSLGEVTMVLTKVLIWFTPIGVCFLVAPEFIGTGEHQVFDLFQAMGYYFLTVLTGLTLHGTVLLPLLYFFGTRKSPFRFIGQMSQALCTAFGTSSSSATLPITIKCLEEKNGVDPRVARFVLPIGATMNMDGTALYEAVAAIWIAQMQSESEFVLDISKIISISIAATAASIGAAGIPHAGVVTMVLVLNSIGLDPGLVAYVIPLDWLLDRFRTMINVLGDSFGAAIIYEMSKKELIAMGPPHLDKSYHSVKSLSKKNSNIVVVPGTSDDDV